MGLFGQSGMYPTNNHYGVKGFYMDFKGGDPADLAKKMKFLKETNCFKFDISWFN